MPDLLQSGTAWLAGMLKQHAGAAVTYTRGVNSVPVQAVVVQQPLQVSDGMGGVGTVWDNFDVMIDTADLVLAGVPVEPASGDRITRVVGGVTVTYEVMAPSGEAVWRWADAYRVKRRIHSRQISQGV